MKNTKNYLLLSSVMLAMTFSNVSSAAYGLPEHAEPVAPAAFASPSDNWYVGAEGGLIYASSFRNNPAWDIGARIGYRFSKIRLEGEYLFQRFTYNSHYFKGATNSHAAMFNAIYDFKGLSSTIIPYIGAGIGVENAHTTAHSYYYWNDIPVVYEVDSSRTSFAYQALAGVGFKLTENLNLDLGYRYFDTTNSSGHHLFNAGINYFFG